jgi:hypothetical protein
MLLKKIEHQISDLDETSVSTARKNTLQLLIDYIQSKVDSKQDHLSEFYLYPQFASQSFITSMGTGVGALF